MLVVLRLIDLMDAPEAPVQVLPCRLNCHHAMASVLLLEPERRHKCAEGFHVELLFDRWPLTVLRLIIPENAKPEWGVVIKLLVREIRLWRWRNDPKWAAWGAGRRNQGVAGQGLRGLADWTVGAVARTRRAKARLCGAWGVGRTSRPPPTGRDPSWGTSGSSQERHSSCSKPKDCSHCSPFSQALIAAV